MIMPSNILTIKMKVLEVSYELFFEKMKKRQRFELKNKTF